jgi:hypothetical protein
VVVVVEEEEEEEEFKALGNVGGFSSWSLWFFWFVFLFGEKWRRRRSKKQRCPTVGGELCPIRMCECLGRHCWHA